MHLLNYAPTYMKDREGREGETEREEFVLVMKEVSGVIVCS